jgi:hypothetical protein
MTDTMTETVLIGVVADFPSGEIRPASMPDGSTVALKTFVIKAIEESVHVEFKRTETDHPAQSWNTASPCPAAKAAVAPRLFRRAKICDAADPGGAQRNHA